MSDENPLCFEVTPAITLKVQKLVEDYHQQKDLVVDAAVLADRTEQLIVAIKKGVEQISLHSVKADRPEHNENSNLERTVSS